LQRHWVPVGEDFPCPCTRPYCWHITPFPSQDMDWTGDSYCQWLLVGQCTFAGWVTCTSQITWYPWCLAVNVHEDMSHPPCAVHLLPCHLCVSACCCVLNLITFTQFIHLVRALHLAWHSAQAPLPLVTHHSMTMWPRLHLSFIAPFCIDPLPCTVSAVSLFCTVLLS
jgi:hypothetical protein